MSGTNSLSRHDGFRLDHVEELRDQLAISELVMEHAADAIFLLDEQGRTVSANPAAERMFGWSRQELQDKTLHDLVHFCHPDGSPYPMKDCPLGHVFSTGTTLKLHEDTFFHRDGRPVHVACSNAAIDRDGSVAGGVLIVRDISERKQAEDHRQLLINELNHRVKNTLAIVQSLAQQSLRGDDLPAGRTAFEGRLAALAGAHDLLTESEWKTASLRQTIEAAVTPFCAVGERCCIEGPEVQVSAETAVALSMAIHELATNATKYGALAVAEGQIEIRWTADADDGTTVLKLVWKEAGGPMVEAPTRQGFGSRMIKRGLASELGGKVTMDFRPGGLVCSIRCALPAPE